MAYFLRGEYDHREIQVIFELGINASMGLYHATAQNKSYDAKKQRDNTAYQTGNATALSLMARDSHGYATYDNADAGEWYIKPIQRAKAGKEPYHHASYGQNTPDQTQYLHNLPLF